MAPLPVVTSRTSAASVAEPVATEPVAAEGPRRRRGLRLALAAVVILWLVACALLGWSARSNLESARDRVERAQSISLARIIDGEGVQELRKGESELRRAHDRISSPIIAPLRIVPVVGRQINSVRALSRASSEALDAGLDALAVVRETIDREGVSPEERPAMLVILADEADTAHGRLRALDLGPAKGLIAPLQEVRSEFAQRLERTTRDLDRARSGLRQFASLLDGQARYLLLAANNAEMRAGSGMFLAAGELFIDKGRLGVTDMVSSTDIGVLDPGEIPVDPELLATWGWAQPGRDLRDIGVTPRFDVSAELAARMWEKTRGGHVDGVMALDPVVLQALLKAVGPIKVDGRKIGAENVVDELLHQQYVDFEDEADRDRAGRKAALGAVAEGAFSSFDRFTWDGTTLANGLAQAAQGRHLMLWSRDPVMQQAWVKAGIGGTLEDGSLMVSVLNYSGTKLDQFLKVATEMTLTVDAAGATTVKLVVSMSNDTPPGEPGYIVGPFPGSDLEAGTYGGVLTVNVPGVATDLRIEETTSLVVNGRDGPTRVIGESFQLGAGAKRESTITFRLPATTRMLRIEPAARVPAMTWKVASEVFDSEAPRWVGW